MAIPDAHEAAAWRTFAATARVCAFKRPGQGGGLANLSTARLRKCHLEEWTVRDSWYGTHAHCRRLRLCCQLLLSVACMRLCVFRIWQTRRGPISCLNAVLSHMVTAAWQRRDDSAKCAPEERCTVVTALIWVLAARKTRPYSGLRCFGCAQDSTYRRFRVVSL